MKTSTIHTNPMGDVLNVTSATGFRVEESPGRIVELRSETGRAVLHVGHHVVTVQSIADMLEQQARSAQLRGKSITKVWLDEIAEENRKYVDDGMGGKVDVTTIEDAFGVHRD